MKKTFVFHAADIINSKPPFDSKDQWPTERRFALVNEILSAIPLYGIPVCFGYSGPAHAKTIRESGRSSKVISNFRHIQSYWTCLERCEEYFRDQAKDERALVMAEDGAAAKKHLQVIHEDMQNGESSIPNHDGLLPLRHIVGAPSFLEKRKEPMLQIADSCAWAIRRYLSGFSDAEKLMDALTIAKWSKVPTPEKLNVGSYVIQSQMLTSDPIFGRLFQKAS